MHSHILRRLVLILFAAILGYSLYFVWQGWDETARALAGFPWLWLPGILLLVSTNFFIREIKWDRFRVWAGLRVPRRGSALTFYSGLSMTISPGRFGELIKPHMLSRLFGVRIIRGVPLVFCERLTDLFGMNVLTLLAFAPFVLHRGALGAGASMPTRFGMAAVTAFFALQLAFMIAAVALIRRKRLVTGMLLWLGRGRLRRLARPLLGMYFDCYDLLTLRRLGWGTLLASFSWSFEVIAFWLICLGVGLATRESLFSLSAPGLSLWDAAFIFCLASIFGGLSTMPGGLGGFEVVTDQLLKMLLISSVTLGVLFPGQPFDAAREAAYGSVGAAIAILRAFTLFYAVILGFVFIGVTTKAYHRRMDWAEFEHVKEEA
jgi:uncharacterized membrane protein YbhN (UPF0104 family)